jgi:hypothetical protein
MIYFIHYGNLSLGLFKTKSISPYFEKCKNIRDMRKTRDFSKIYESSIENMGLTDRVGRFFNVQCCNDTKIHIANSKLLDIKNLSVKDSQDAARKYWSNNKIYIDNAEVLLSGKIKVISLA